MANTYDNDVQTLGGLPYVPKIKLDTEDLPKSDLKDAPKKSTSKAPKE
jgi:hypothetical protein